MIYSNCDAALSVIGPLFLIIGSSVAYVGLLAWVKPNSSIIRTIAVNRYSTEEEADPILGDLGFTRETLGPLNVMMFRLLVPPIGTVFAVLGLWITISQIHCGLRFPDLRPLWGPLAWRPISFFFVVFVVFVGLIGAWNARQMRPVFRELCVLLALVFGVASAEAATYHVGVQANRWFVIAMTAVVVSGLVWYLSDRFSAKATSP